MYCSLRVLLHCFGLSNCQLSENIPRKSKFLFVFGFTQLPMSHNIFFRETKISISFLLLSHFNKSCHEYHFATTTPVWLIQSSSHKSLKRIVHTDLKKHKLLSLQKQYKKKIIKKNHRLSSTFNVSSQSLRLKKFLGQLECRKCGIISRRHNAKTSICGRSSLRYVHKNIF